MNEVLRRSMLAPIWPGEVSKKKSQKIWTVFNCKKVMGDKFVFG